MDKIKKLIKKDYCGTRYLVKPIIQLIGVIFIILGLIGIFIPILPGPLFIFIGLIILGLEKKFIEKYVNNYCKKFKKN